MLTHINAFTGAKSCTQVVTQLLPFAQIYVLLFVHIVRTTYFTKHQLILYNFYVVSSSKIMQKIKNGRFYPSAKGV